MNNFFKKLSVILGIMFLGGLGGIIMDRYFFPQLISTKFFSKYEFLKKSIEGVTIINKTEQLVVKEETSINKISNQASSSVVNIASYSENQKAKNSILKNGTGVIVTSDGLIMSYQAAVDISNSGVKYKVITQDGKIYDAEFKGLDSYSNLVFFKISASNLPVISLSDSLDDTPGEKVVAIGNSFGSYSNNYNGGLLGNFNSILSLSGKALSSSEKLEGVFSTDFFPGNNFLGGPVVDYMGQTIGITGSILTSNETIYFQIPSNKIKKVIDRAIKGELGKNPTLGIYFIPITTTFSLANKLTVNKGAMIYSPSGQQGLAIISGSPAQKAGLRINDIITSINGQEINLENTLPDLLYKYKQGEEVEFSVLRDGQDIKIKAQI